MKNYATYAFTSSNCKKNSKMQISHRTVKKIIRSGAKNKKLHGNFSVHFYMLQLTNQPPTQNLRKTAKMTEIFLEKDAGSS